MCEQAVQALANSLSVCGSPGASECPYIDILAWPPFPRILDSPPVTRSFLVPAPFLFISDATGLAALHRGSIYWSAGLVVHALAFERLAGRDMNWTEPLFLFLDQLASWPNGLLCVNVNGEVVSSILVCCFYFWILSLLFSFEEISGLL